MNLYNKFTCLSVCLSVCLFGMHGLLNGWADFKTFLAGDYPWVGDGFRPKIFLIGPKKKKFFFSVEKIFFRKFFDFSKIFQFFQKFQNFQKKFHVKIFYLKKKSGQSKFAVERAKRATYTSSI